MKYTSAKLLESAEYIAVGDFDDETASFEMFDYESLPLTPII